MITTKLTTVPTAQSAKYDENTNPQTDSNIRFQVAIRGWSDRNHQTRAETLLALSTEKMVKALQIRQDILLIPREWWSDPHNTLRSGGTGMVVYSIKRNVVPWMKLVQKQDRQGSPGRGLMSGMSGKSQETKEFRLEEEPRQKPKGTP